MYKYTSSLLSFLCQPNIPKFRGEYFAIQTLFAQVALGDYSVHEKHALHITQVCINSGDIISNLLLSRAYFPHLFHMISAKVKKSFSSSQKTFNKWPLLAGRTSAICCTEVRPRSEVNTCGSDLTLGSHTGACGNVA